MTGIGGFRTVYFGPEDVLVTADIAFGSDLDTEALDSEITAIEDELQRIRPDISKIYIEPERSERSAVRRERIE